MYWLAVPGQQRKKSKRQDLSPFEIRLRWTLTLALKKWVLRGSVVVVVVRLVYIAQFSPHKHRGGAGTHEVCGIMRGLRGSISNPHFHPLKCSLLDVQTE